MAKCVITQAYRVDGGWRKRPRQLLTPETAEELRSQGYTLLRTKRRWHRAAEVSIAQYLRVHRE